MKFKFTLILTILLSVILCFNTQAINEITEPQIGGTYTQADTTQTYGLLVGTPLDVINGFAYADWQRASDDGEVLAENSTLYLEGGIPVHTFALSGYVKGTRDEGRIEGWQRDAGYFLRLPEYQVKGLTVTGGGGNFARNEIPELGLDADTTFNWRAFVELKHSLGLNLLLESNATIDFENPEFTATPFTSIEVGSHFTLDLSVEVLRSKGEFHTTTLIAGKKTF